MSTPKDSTPVEFDADGFVILPASAGEVSPPSAATGAVAPASPSPRETREPVPAAGQGAAGEPAPAEAVASAESAEPTESEVSAESTGSTRAVGSADDSVAVSEFDDPRRPLLRAMKMGSIALLVVTIVSLVGWGAYADLAGIWGVVIGAIIGGGFVLLTVISVLATSKTDITTTAVVVMAGWLMKMIILIAVLWALSGMTFYNTLALVVTIIASLVIVLIAETWGVITARVTYMS